MHKLTLHESILRVLDEFAEINHQAPRVRPETLQPFKQNCADLLLDQRLAFHEEENQDQAEVERVGIGVPELIHNGVEERQPSLVIKLVHYLLEEFVVLFLRHV